MANRNTQGFGLIPAGRLGGGPSIQGQGKYYFEAYVCELLQSNYHTG